jgi:hypothetical protein
MDKETVYRKTSKGTEALAARGSLAPRQRSLMILVDGRRNADELGKLGAACGDVGELLHALESQGLIEVTVQRPAAAAARPASAATPLPLAQARSLAVRRLNDMLGPEATELCLRIEATRSPQEFHTAVRRVGSALRDVVGPQRAAQFVSELENQQAA